MVNKITNQLPVENPAFLIGHDPSGAFDRQAPAPIAFSGLATDATNGVSVIATSTYTIAPSDNNKLLVFTASATVTVTLANTIAAGFACSGVQWGAGKVKCVVQSGSEIRNSDGHNGTRAQYSGFSLSVPFNTGGNTANFHFQGDTAVVP
jgi:hypothetical protein